MFYAMKNNMQNKQHDLIKLITEVKVEKGKIWLGKVLLHSIQFHEYLLKAFYVSSSQPSKCLYLNQRFIIKEPGPGGVALLVRALSRTKQKIQMDQLTHEVASYNRSLSNGELENI